VKKKKKKLPNRLARRKHRRKRKDAISLKKKREISARNSPPFSDWGKGGHGGGRGRTGYLLEEKKRRSATSFSERGDLYLAGMVGKKS